MQRPHATIPPAAQHPENGSTKLLLVAPVFAPDVGGVPTLYHQVCLHLPVGSVAVVAPNHPDSARFDALQPYPIHRIPPFAEIDVPSFPRWALDAVRVAAIARKERATHICLGHVNLCLLAFLMAPFNRRSTFLYAHGEEIIQPIGGRLGALIQHRFLKSVAQVVAVSRFTEQAITTISNGHAQVAVIPNAVDVTDFHPAPKDPQLVEQYGLAGRKVILTLSRLERRKGHDKVIEALPGILRQVPDAHYLIVGQGEERGRLEALAARMDVADRVTFAGGVDQNMLCHFYNLGDLFIMPNRRVTEGAVTEGFGIVFLEAGACGKPVVGGRDGGVPDAVEDGVTGYLVDGNDVLDIETRVVSLLNNPEMAARMGEEGRRFASEHSYPALVKKLQIFMTDRPT